MSDSTFEKLPLVEEEIEEEKVPESSSKEPFIGTKSSKKTKKFAYPSGARALIYFFVFVSFICLIARVCFIYHEEAYAKTTSTESKVSKSNSDGYSIWDILRGKCPGREDMDEVNKPVKRNVVLMISDGLGMGSLEMIHRVDENSNLSMESHLLGFSAPKSTKTSHGPIDDTAIACGVDANNGESVGLYASGLPSASLVEAAKQAGFRTGIVVTSRITDDTPAAFTSHVRSVLDPSLIAQHQLGMYPLGRNIDLLIGGGRCAFLPNSTTASCRGDDKDLWNYAETNGWTVVKNMQQYIGLNHGANVSLPLISLLSETDFPFEVDRDQDKYPSIDSTTLTALRSLAEASKDSDRGFFLVIEGSKIDNAAHDNDPVAQYHEVMAYDRAFKTVVDFAKDSSVETVVLSISNHDTGNLKVVKSENSVPSGFSSASRSCGYIVDSLAEDRICSNSPDASIRVSQMFKEFLGITDLTEEELNTVVGALDSSAGTRTKAISRIVSSRSGLVWSSEDHTVESTPVFGYSTNERVSQFLSRFFRTYAKSPSQISHMLERLMHIDLAGVTKQLNKVSKEPTYKGYSPDNKPESDWMGYNMGGYRSMMDRPCSGSRK